MRSYVTYDEYEDRGGGEPVPVVIRQARPEPVLWPSYELLLDFFYGLLCVLCVLGVMLCAFTVAVLRIMREVANREPSEPGRHRARARHKGRG